MHSLVQARFDPRASAYWLPDVGRETAARIPARRFWALRANLSLSDQDNPDPPYLFLLSNHPSPYPFPEATISIGPKCTLPDLELSHTDARLLVRPPIPTTDDLLHLPVYLHTVPRLRCNWLHSSPMEKAFFRLKGDHLVDFIDTAIEALEIAQQHCLQGHRAFPRKILGHRGISTSRPLPIVSRTYLFGELHDPISYVFRFGTVDELTYPEKLEPTRIYEHILLYKQVCIDYRWRAVNVTIDWVKMMRKGSSRRLRVPFRFSQLGANAASSVRMAQVHAEALWDEEDQFFGEDGASKQDPDDEIYLPFAFPMLAYQYPVVTLGRPKVIAFELFGTLLDREGAIQRALEPWISFLPCAVSTSDLALLYIEVEVQTAYDRRSEACSLAAIVNSTLARLAMRLNMPQDRRSASVAKATTTILNPPLFPGALDALVFLARSRYTLVCIPSFSESTLQHVRHYLPSELMSILHICPAAASPYFSSRHIFPALLQKCKDIVPGGVKPGEILVVSTGVGRILAPAIAEGCATALVRRPGCLEAHVDFDVGKDGASPVPSVTITGLLGLCRRLRHFSFLVPDESSSSPSISGADIENMSTTAASSDVETAVSGRSARDRDPTEYIWSFTIRGAYQTTQFLGEGAIAYVLRAFHTLTGTEVAAKLSATPADQTKRAFVEHEITVYKILHGAPLGIPTIHWSGRDGNYAVLIMDRLGPSLSALRRFCRGSFSLRTMCVLALQMLSRLEFVHSRGIVVCDIKPQNFAMGMGATANVLYLFDFGHAALYIDPHTGTHVPPDRRRHAIGTVLYASVAAHMRQAISRRDDVESLLYVLVELYEGRLPWRDFYRSKVDDAATQERRMRENKEGAAFAAVLDELPPEFAAYHKHCTGLAFGQAPDYEYLKNLFRWRMLIEGWGADTVYDWACGGMKGRGTLIPEEYVFDLKYCCPDVDLDP